MIEDQLSAIAKSLDAIHKSLDGMRTAQDLLLHIAICEHTEGAVQCGCEASSIQAILEEDGTACPFEKDKS